MSCHKWYHIWFRLIFTLNATIIENVAQCYSLTVVHFHPCHECCQYYLKVTIGYHFSCLYLCLSILPKRPSFCQTVESRSHVAPQVEIPGDKIKIQIKNIEFWVFVDPIGRNQLHHTSILSNRWDLPKIICLWRITSTNVSILTPQYILCDCQFTTYKRFIHRVFHLAVSFQTLCMHRINFISITEIITQSLVVVVLGKTSIKKNVFFRALPESPNPPPWPQFGQLGPLFFTSKTAFWEYYRKKIWCW